jgi:ferrous iron transport protein A
LKELFKPVVNFSKSEKVLRLSELEKGAVASICCFKSTSSELGRLRDMGLHVGTHFRVIKFAPGGDPIEIKARGYYMSLRKLAADHIYVERK